MENVKELELAEFAAIEEALKAVSSHAAPTRETSHATWQEDRGMNDRVKMLRHQSETTQPYIDMERALIETETYKRYEALFRSPSFAARCSMTTLSARPFALSPAS